MEYIENVSSFPDIGYKMSPGLFVPVPHFLSKKATETNLETEKLKSEVATITTSWPFQTVADLILSSDRVDIINCSLSTWITDQFQAPWKLTKSVRCDYSQYFVNRRVENSTESTITLTMRESEYFIPPNGVFYLTDIGSMNRYPEVSKFDIIYIDPPWKNKSVKRGKKYSTNDMALLETLNIPERLSENGYFIIWITNNERVEQYVTSLMEQYGMEQKSCWKWIKLAASGKTVYPFDNPHKSPWERLLFFGRKNVTHIPNKTFAAIPSRIHSQKPNLHQLIETAVNIPDAEKVEFFARTVVSGIVMKTRLHSFHVIL